MSSRLSFTIVPAAPPHNANLNFEPFVIPPPKSSMIWRNVKPNGASKSPGFLTWPKTIYIFVPGVEEADNVLHQSAPFFRIGGTAQNASTLLTAVGCPRKPYVGG